jgi:hypothetical protein
MLVLVYQSIDRLLSRKSSAVKSDKAGLGDKVPHKTTMWFCGFLGRVFFARNGFMRIQHTIFPQRACERCAQDCKQPPIILFLLPLS